MSALSNSNRSYHCRHAWGSDRGRIAPGGAPLLVPEVIGLALDFQHFDLSLEKRRATQNE